MRGSRWFCFVFVIGVCGCTAETTGGGSQDQPGEENKPPGESPNPGSENIDTDTFVEPGKRVMRRLTAAQYRNSVEVALGMVAPGDLALPVDRQISAFANGERQAAPTSAVATTYAAAAKRMAALATEPGNRERLFQSNDCGDVNSCLQSFIRAVGRRLFRRPLDQADVDVLSSVSEAAGGELWQRAALALEIMLQSPPFLYVFDEGEASKEHPELVERDSFSLATRISLLLWNSGPDEELLAAAEAGRLGTITGLRAEVNRLLADKRALESQKHFLQEWFGYDLAPGQSKGDTHGAFTPALAQSMVEEADKLVVHLLESGANISEIFTADFSFGDDAIMDFYGANTERLGDGRFKLPERRRGLFSTAAFLAANSGSEKPSPTIRGLGILERFLCASVGAPPENAPTELPSDDKDDTLTVRERTERFMLAPGSVCRGCHQNMDPIGFLFEEFDVIGKQRSVESVNGVERPVDARGDVAVLQKGDVDGVPGLGQLLATSEDAKACLVEHLLEWTFGRADRAGDEPLVKNLLGLSAEASAPLGLMFEAVALNRSLRFTRAN